MTVRYTNFDVQSGDTFQVAVRVASGSGGPVDLSSASLAGMVRTDFNVQNIAANFTFQIVSPQSGSFIMMLTPQQTATLTARKYVYDVVAMESGSAGVINDYRLLRGNLFILPAVTR